MAKKQKYETVFYSKFLALKKQQAKGLTGLSMKQKFAVKLQTVKLFKFTYSELAAGIYVCKGS
jgi:hypothetical protein